MTGNQSNIHHLPELAPWLTEEKLGEVESVVRVIETHDTTLFSELKPKALREVAVAAAGMGHGEMHEFFSYVIKSAGIMRGASGANVLFVRALAAITPLIHAVPVSGRTPEEAEALKHQNVLMAATSSMSHKATLGIPRILWRLVTGTYDKLMPNERDLARGCYLREVTDRKITEADAEWFGHHWEEIVPLLDRLTLADSYSRGYAEELLANRDITGTTLMDGVL